MAAAAVACAGFAMPSWALVAGTAVIQPGVPGCAFGALLVEFETAVTVQHQRAAADKYK